MNQQMTLSSVPVPSTAESFCVRWEAVPRATAYVLCRLQVPVGPAQEAALFSGGLDLLMERYVVGPAVMAIREARPSELRHRLVLARLPGDRFEVADFRLAPDDGDALPLEDAGPPAASLSAPIPVGTPKPSASQGRYASPRRLSQTQVTEIGSTARNPSSFVEGSPTVRGPDGGPRRS